jgi:predicted acylesterase/phospholipase RssA
MKPRKKLPASRPRSKPVNPRRPIFAIFEGGGAKGVAHVGALQAVEDNNLEIIGVAGTSAGALIALMVALGLKADDIMSGDDPAANIISRNGQTPVGLLGAKPWRRFQRLRRRGKCALVSGFIWGGIINLATAPRIMASLLQITERLGHFNTVEIQQFINQVIRERLATIKHSSAVEWEVPEKPTFRDLACGWPSVIPLKIVVTDVDNGSLAMFDAHSTPDVVIAEAVAASIAIPIAFEPASIPSFRAGCFADGGLVSNLPIWGFVEEKLCHEREHHTKARVPVIGFSLAAPPPSDEATAQPIAFTDYLLRLVYAALQGSQATTARFIDDVFIIPIHSPLDMLAFDADWQSFRDSRVAGADSANNQLRFILDTKPDRILKELVETRDKALRRLNRIRKGASKSPVHRIRVNLIRPFGTHSLRVMESLDMEHDADDRLLLDRRGRGAAVAFRKRGLRIFRMGADFEKPGLEYMTKYERALVRQTVKTVICVPIFAENTAWTLEEPDRPEPAGILTIDTDDELFDEFQDGRLVNMLVKQATILYSALNVEIDDG